MIGRGPVALEQVPPDPHQPHNPPSNSDDPAKSIHNYLCQIQPLRHHKDVPVTRTIKTAAAPSLVRLGEVIYLSWSDRTTGEVWTSTFCQGDWSQPQVVPGAHTTAGPVLAASGGQLYVSGWTTWVPADSIRMADSRPEC